MPVTTSTPSQEKPHTKAKTLGATVANNQRRFLQVALNGSKADEPAGVLAGS